MNTSDLDGITKERLRRSSICEGHVMNIVPFANSWKPDASAEREGIRTYITERAALCACQRYRTRNLNQDRVEQNEAAIVDTSTDELTTESANESKEQPVSVRIMSLLDKLRDGLQYTVIEQRDAAHFCAPSISAESILDEALNGWLVHVAEDPNAQIEVLSELARAADAEIRIAVAENRNTPRELLLILAQDENPDVRYAMAENHNLDAIIIESFLEDDNPYVCERAKRTLSRLQEKSVIAPQFRQENESSKRQSVMH